MPLVGHGGWVGKMQETDEPLAFLFSFGASGVTKTLG